MTAYVLRTGEPQLIDSERYQSLIEQDEIVALGVTTEESSWLGVPLDAERETVGVLAVQSYTAEHQYTEHDRDLLAFVGQHVGAALSRARAIEETRQRNAELAVINSVQDAIAGELDQQAIYDAVGDRIQEIFDAQVVAITTFDETTGLTHHPYIIERGERLYQEPDLPAGFEQHVLETREPVLLVENLADEVERYGSEVVVGEMPKSVLFVPLLVGGKATGVISLQNIDREHAFSESDEELFETLAASLSVALENARLVHETRQRNAELALINSVQEALAGELEMQAIYDVVGDRVGEIFDAQGMAIAIVDEATGLVTLPVPRSSAGERLSAGADRHRSRLHQARVRDAGAAADQREPRGRSERYGSFVVAGEKPKSVLWVPLIVGRRGERRDLARQLRP